MDLTKHPSYPGCLRGCKLYRGRLGWQHVPSCPNVGMKLDASYSWVWDDTKTQKENIDGA